MVYPNGRTIDYSYGSGMANTNAALDQAIGRLDAIVDPEGGLQTIDIGTGSPNSGDAGTVLEQYSYLGLSTIVARNHPQTGINLTLIGSSGSIGAGGDEYVGLDQFGRVVNQNWVNSSGSTVDGYTYTYDANGNVLSKNNVLDSAYSQGYTYDALNRLTSATQGGSAYQSWNLDAQGNWSSFTTNGSIQTRTANGQNQITGISGTSATPTYDANGNMISDQNGDTLIYDAWNRLVEVKNASGQVIAQYTYNAQGYVVTATYSQGTSQVPAGTTNYLYYTSSWQLIEVRTGGTANSNVTEQMVWSAAYINAPVLQDTYSAGVIQPNSRLYFTQDANWNTTAVVGYDVTSGTWQVVQRYVYSPYGTLTILNANFTATPAGTVPLVNNLFQSMANDPVTGLYYERARWYSPSLGTWVSQDPAGFINGANTYQFVVGNPVGRVDAGGLQVDGGGDGGDAEDGDGAPPPPPVGFWQDMLDIFGYGVQEQTGPPDYPLPAGYVWAYPPVIQAPGTPFDPSLWQVTPADPNNPATPQVQTQGPDGNNLPFPQQVENARRAAQSAANAAAARDAARDAARPSCPKTVEGAGNSATSPVGRSGQPIKIQSGTNEPTNIGGRDYSGHALDQMQGRGVPPLAVENTIQNGMPSPDPIPGRIRYYDPVNNLTVVTESDGTVVTVHPGEP